MFHGYILVLQGTASSFYFQGEEILTSMLSLCPFYMVKKRQIMLQEANWTRLGSVKLETKVDDLGCWRWKA